MKLTQIQEAKYYRETARPDLYVFFDPKRNSFAALQVISGKVEFSEYGDISNSSQFYSPEDAQQAFEERREQVQEYHNENAAAEILSDYNNLKLVRISFQLM